MALLPQPKRLQRGGESNPSLLRDPQQVIRKASKRSSAEQWIDVERMECKRSGSKSKNDLSRVLLCSLGSKF
jgi:hypothetical protein